METVVSSQPTPPSPVEVVVTQRDAPAACVTGKIDPSCNACIFLISFNSDILMDSTLSLKTCLLTMSRVVRVIAPQPCGRGPDGGRLPAVVPAETRQR